MQADLLKLLAAVAEAHQFEQYVTSLNKQLFVSQAEQEKQQRLQKSRCSAKERRQKKKLEMSSLAAELEMLQNENDALKLHLRNLPFQKQRLVLVRLEEETSNSSYMGCLFCSERCSSETTLLRHYKVAHSFELRSNMASLDKNLHLEDLVKPKLMLDVLERKHADLASVMHQSVPKYKLANEGKDKLRLARNAESARLSRQRKKIRFQKCRIMIPMLHYENEILKKYLHISGPILGKKRKVGDL